jgi:hypothetical protein
MPGTEACRTPPCTRPSGPAGSHRDWAKNTDTPKEGTKRRAETVSVKEPAGENTAPPLSPGGTSLLQARTVNEVVKAQTNKVRLARLKGELVDRPQAIAHVFKLARAERDAWLNWPARISAQMASKLAVDAHTLHVALEMAIREHLQELGDVRPRVD